MKKSLFFTAVLMLFAGTVFAQQQPGSGLQEASTKRGPYLTNRFFDNWFLQVGAGAQVYVGEYDHMLKAKDRLAPALDVALGKWITPSIGLRLEYSGLKAKGYTYGQTLYATGDMKEGGYYNEKFNYSFLHGDVMWNISNAIGGYRADRFWNFVPYLGAGWARSYKGDRHSDQAAVAIGLQHNLRICDALDFNIDMRQMFVNQSFDGVRGGRALEGMSTITLGFTYKFKKRGFNRPTVAVPADYTPYVRQINGLKDQLAASQQDNEALAKQLAAAKAQTPKTIVRSADVAPMAVFFQIGQANVTEKETINLGYLAEVIKASPDKKFVVVGSADKATGTPKRNQQLSQERADNVYDILVNKFGVNPSQLQVVAKGASDEPFDQPVLNRVTIVEATK